MDADDNQVVVVEACTFVHRHPLLLCFLFFLAFLYAFLYPVFAFLLASSPVLLLTAFLLGLVLLHSVPQEHEHHVYKKISRPPQSQTTTVTVRATTRPSPSTSSSDSDNPPAIMSTATSLASFPDATGDESSSDSELDRPQQKHNRRPSQEVVRAVAWTADDMKSIENIGSLELERNAAVEKLMSERLSSPRPPQRRGHAAARKSNPFDLDDEDFPGSAPSMPSRNPFFDDDDDLLPLHHAPQPQLSSQGAQQKNAMLFRRHESFTVGAPHASDFRPSRFRPYFTIDKMQGQQVAVPAGSKSSPSSSSSSSSSLSAGVNAYAAVSTHNKEEEEAAEREEALAEAEAEAMLEAKTDDRPEFVVRPREVVALDVELISDSSDDDISLPEPMKKQQQQQAPPPPQEQVAVVVADQDDDDDEGESFEVESITKQVAAAAQGKGKQLDPAYDYSKSAAGTVEEEKKKEHAALPPLAPPSMAQIKLASMRRVFSEEEADAPMAEPSGLEEKEEGREQDMFPLPPLPESAAAAGAAPPLAAAAKKGIGKSSKYKPPSKKAVLGFFQGKGKA